MQNDQQTKKDPRHLARLLALQLLYTKYFTKQSALEANVFEPQALLDIIDEAKFDTKLYIQLIEGVEKFSKEINLVIQQIAPAWPLDQINPVNLIILQIAIWEAFIAQITPPKVAINEAIELDKVLSTINNSAFINGVLGNIFNNEAVLAKLNKLGSKQ